MYLPFPPRKGHSQPVALRLTMGSLMLDSLKKRKENAHTRAHNFPPVSSTFEWSSYLFGIGVGTGKGKKGCVIDLAQN